MLLVRIYMYIDIIIRFVHPYMVSLVGTDDDSLYEFRALTHTHSHWYKFNRTYTQYICVYII